LLKSPINPITKDVENPEKAGVTSFKAMRTAYDNILSYLKRGDI